jgi:hypothetical protein
LGNEVASAKEPPEEVLEEEVKIEELPF